LRSSGIFDMLAPKIRKGMARILPADF